MSNEEKNLSLTANDLKELFKQQAEENAKTLAAVIAAVKAPTEIEQQKIDQQKARIQQDNETRKESAEQIKQDMANKAFRKSACAHQSGSGGSHHYHTVFVSDDLGGYVLCQKCNAVIRPENQLGSFPKDFRTIRTDVIFNTALFNTLFQTTNQSGVFA
jgi:hypothetical protein